MGIGRLLLLAALALLTVLLAVLAGCGSGSSGDQQAARTGDVSGSEPKGCRLDSPHSGCVALGENDLFQTSFTYPRRIVKAYRDGRRVDVYTNLSDGQYATGYEICGQVFIDSVPDQVGIDIAHPLIVVWSRGGVVLATGAEPGVGCTRGDR